MIKRNYINHYFLFHFIFQQILITDIKLIDIIIITGLVKIPINIMLFHFNIDILLQYTPFIFGVT